MLEKGKLTKFILGFSVILIMLFILYLLRIVFIPILLSFFIAYLLNPLVELLERKKISRITATVSILLILLVISFFLTSILLTIIQLEISIVSEKLPSYIATIANTILPWLKKIFILIDIPTTVGEFFVHLTNYARGLSPDIISMLAKWLSSTFSDTLSYLIGLLGFLILPFYVFYILRDYRKIKTMVWRYIPPNQRYWFDLKWDEVDYILNAFLRGQLILSFIMIILYSISLYIIGVELSFFIGVVAGVAFIVPFMGLIVGILLGGTMALLQFQDLLHPLYVIVAFVVLQIIEAYLITPKLIGRKVGLHPVVTVVSILVWGEVLGMFGVVIAIPLTAILKVFLKSITDNFLNSPLFDA